MNTTVEVTPTACPVYRVKIIRKNFPAKFRYFTTEGKAMKFAAWQLVEARHRINDTSYTVHGITCECADPESGPGYYSAGWEGCPLHDHRDGYYARMVARIIARMKHQAEAIRY